MTPIQDLFNKIEYLKQASAFSPTDVKARADACLVQLSRVLTDQENRLQEIEKRFK